MTNVNKQLAKYISDPTDPKANFELGTAYEQIGQTASAVSFFLRTAEKTDDLLLKYAALLKCGMCFNAQGSRNMTTRGLFQHAISVMPDRPEAYYFLSTFHERVQEWQESYMMASIGLSMAAYDQEDLPTDISYPGKFALLFQKGVAAWWVGMCTQSREILLDLRDNHEMDDLHTKCVESNLLSIGTGEPIEETKYLMDMCNDLRYQFKGCEDITKNYAQSYQDMFVLSMLDGKRNGKYLEVGCADPFYNNNTALLETQFGWNGVSIDIDPRETQKFEQERDNTVICADATTVDFGELFEEGDDIDYLQIDCDPPFVSLAILQRMPFDTNKFATITFEHDAYADVHDIAAKSREFLKSKGYTLVARNIAFDKTNSYEDWWVHPHLVDDEIIKKMRDISLKATYCKDYMLPG